LPPPTHGATAWKKNCWHGPKNKNSPALGYFFDLIYVIGFYLL
jgi:hypothetical protein